MSESLVIIPTYNEIENIEAMIRRVFTLPHRFELLIIDDGSPDGTAQRVKELQDEFHGQLHLLQRSGKLGLGTAYILGFRWALERHYEFVFCQIDGCQYMPAVTFKASSAVVDGQTSDKANIQ